MRRHAVRLAVNVALAAALAAAANCGGPPSTPTATTTTTTTTIPPPVNNLPVIDAITIQGTRSRQPASFADVGERITVSAKAHDDETPSDQLQYAWTATAGSFSAAGAIVTWTAPDAAPAPVDVVVTLTVTEKYGPGQAFEHSTTANAPLSLHDSVREVGDMARQFLLDFSDSNIRDVPHILRNFSRGACPEPNEIDSEFADVTRNRDERRITASTVGAPATTVNFGASCPFRFKRGDACSVVPVFWADVDLKTGVPSTTRGNDIVAAAYSSTDKRWWLCASDYQGLSTVGKPFTFSR